MVKHKVVGRNRVSRYGLGQCLINNKAVGGKFEVAWLDR